MTFGRCLLHQRNLSHRTTLYYAMQSPDLPFLLIPPLLTHSSALPLPFDPSPVPIRPFLSVSVTTRNHSMAASSGGDTSSLDPSGRRCIPHTTYRVSSLTTIITRTALIRHHSVPPSPVNLCDHTTPYNNTPSHPLLLPPPPLFVIR